MLILSKVRCSKGKSIVQVAQKIEIPLIRNLKWQLNNTMLKFRKIKRK